MSNVKYSFIMPIYGVEEQLRTAVDSVLAQTHGDFEIILVDDASPDGCPAICDEYAARYDNITCIHHAENQGLSAARNTGLQHAVGTYVTFTDPDDRIDATLLERVDASLAENPADCVIFGICEEYCDRDGAMARVYELTYGEEKRISSVTALRQELIRLEEKTFLGYAWNKLYRREIIAENGLSFEKVTLIEDIVFNLHFFEHARSLNILNCAPYHYMKRTEGSLTAKFVPQYYALHRRRVAQLLALYRGWDLCSDEVCRILGNLYARYIYSALQRNCDKRSGMNGAARRAFLKSVFEDEMFSELSPFIDIGGYAGILYTCLKKRRTGLCLFFGRVIYAVKEGLPVVFAAAKQKG